jgi:hypothetical protein
MDIGFQILPVTLIVTDISAPGANGQQFLKSFYLFETLFELGYEFPAFNGILDRANQLTGINLALD